MDAYKKELAELKQEVCNRSAALPELNELTFTVSDLHCKMPSSQIRIQELKQKLLTSLGRTGTSTGNAADTEQVGLD